MKAGDLVRFERVNGNFRYGIFLGFKKDNGYSYSEVFWNDENTVGTIQSDLLEVINESR